MIYVFKNEVIMIQKKELNGSSFVSYFELKHDHFWFKRHLKNMMFLDV